MRIIKRFEVKLNNSVIGFSTLEKAEKFVSKNGGEIITSFDKYDTSYKGVGGYQGTKYSANSGRVRSK